MVRSDQTRGELFARLDKVKKKQRKDAHWDLFAVGGARSVQFVHLRELKTLNSSVDFL